MQPGRTYPPVTDTLAMSSSKGYLDYAVKPRFIDQLAVDFVVGERRYLKLRPAEKRHAAHRLNRDGVTHAVIAEILRVTPRTVERMLSAPPPPILDIDEHGNLFEVDAEVVA